MDSDKELQSGWREYYRLEEMFQFLRDIYDVGLRRRRKVTEPDMWVLRQIIYDLGTFGDITVPPYPVNVEEPARQEILKLRFRYRQLMDDVWVFHRRHTREPFTYVDFLRRILPMTDDILYEGFVLNPL